MANIEAIARTLHELAKPDMKRKDLVAAVRGRHPEASKKDVVRAAFYALTAGMDGDAERALRLQDFALSERAPEDNDQLPVHTKRKKHKRVHDEWSGSRFNSH